MNFRNWDGKPLIGKWLFTIKIDGIQARSVMVPPPFMGTFIRSIRTKGGSPIYNLPSILPPFETAEIFCGSWNETMSIARASKSERRKIKTTEIYPLFPNVDPRLVIGTFTNPSAELIKIAFNQAQMDEHEGLVLRQIGTTNYIKVKGSYTEDVKITGWVEGKGRLKGKLGKLTTDNGDVGTGFTDFDRALIWSDIKKGKICKGICIEVEGMEKTNDGKIRHPRFVRFRFDK